MISERNLIYDNRLGILTGSGEFDTIDCPRLLEEVRILAGSLARDKGTRAIAYQFYDVIFMNTTVLGAMEKARKTILEPAGIRGYLVIPTSAAVEDVFTKLKMDKVIPMRTMNNILRELKAA